MGLFDKLKNALGGTPEPEPKRTGNRSGGNRNRGGQGNRNRQGGASGTRTSGGSGNRSSSNRNRSGSQRTRSTSGNRSGTQRRVTRTSGEDAGSEQKDRPARSGNRNRNRSGGSGGGQRRSGGSGGGSSSSSSSRGRGRNRNSNRTRRERTRRGSASSGSHRRVLDANERPKDPVKKQILINASDPNQIRVAIREQERVVEVYVERKGKRSLAGNIYKGRVQNVLPGMEACFVDIGLERNGFLYVDEVTPAAADSDQAMPVKLATGDADDVTADGGDVSAGTDATASANAADSEGTASANSTEATATDEVPAIQSATLVTASSADVPQSPGALSEVAASDVNASDDSSVEVDTDVPIDAEAIIDEAKGGDGAKGRARSQPSGRRRVQQKRKIQELLTAGQEILVQVVKDPMGTKGSRLTTQYSLAGRYLVYVPDGEGLGVSRRLTDDERTRLRDIVKEFELPHGGGLIVRTAAEGARGEDIGKDLQLLLALHEKLMEQAGGQRAPKLLYNEADLSLRLIRDLFNDEVESVIVDDKRQYQRIVTYLKRTSPTLVDRVEFYEKPEPMFVTYGVEQAIKSTLNKRANLPSGGYLIIDYAEAFTVIDINTGRNVGKTSLEETITKTNMEAAEEIVRQLRLRDIGGIIVIDFIDMNLMKNRDSVLEHFRKELSKDRTKTYIVEISPLGLVEMTRQNVSDGVREILVSSCASCEGRGVVVSAETRAIELERAITDMATALSDEVEAVVVDVAPEVHNVLAGTAGRRREIDKRAGKRVRLMADPDLDTQSFVVTHQGNAEEVDAMPERLRRGAQLTVKIDLVDALDARDGIATIDGVTILVIGAGNDVGEEKPIRILASEGNRAFAAVVRPARRRRRRGGRGRGKAGSGAGTMVEEIVEDEEIVVEEAELEHEPVDQELAADLDGHAAEIPERLVVLDTTLDHDDHDDDEDDDDDDFDDRDDSDDDEDDDDDDHDGGASSDASSDVASDRSSSNRQSGNRSSGNRQGSGGQRSGSGQRSGGSGGGQRSGSGQRSRSGGGSGRPSGQRSNQQVRPNNSAQDATGSAHSESADTSEPGGSGGGASGAQGDGGTQRPNAQRRRRGSRGGRNRRGGGGGGQSGSGGNQENRNAGGASSSSSSSSSGGASSGGNGE